MKSISRLVTKERTDRQRSGGGRGTGIYRMLMILGWSMILFLSGCTRGTPVQDFGGEEGKQIADLIDDLNDFKWTDEKIVSNFASNAGIPSSADLSRFDYSIIGQPQVDGDSATCNIRLDHLDGAPASEREWRFKKVGGSWKLETAPL
jgi:hypothetical protein